MGKNFKAVQNQIQSSEQTEKNSKQSKIKYNRHNKRKEFQSSQKSNTILRTNELLRPCRAKTNGELWMQWRSWEPVELQQTTLCAGDRELLLLAWHLMLEKVQCVQCALLYLVSWYYIRHKKNVGFFTPNVLTRNYSIQILWVLCDIKCFQKQIQTCIFFQALWPSKALHCVLNFAHPLQVTFW